MLQGLLYFIIIVFANTIGSVSGMGGGVIIKPVLDTIALDSVATISFYSTVAVFVMSVVSTARQVQAGQQLALNKLLYLAAGSIVGGYLGSTAFTYLLSAAGNQLAQISQIVLTILVLVWALLAARNVFAKQGLQKMIWYLACGLLLGFLSSFLGIGGGPINVSLFMILFSSPIKEATLYSIATIFFSQLSKLVSLLLIEQFTHYDGQILLFIIVAAIVGGLLGAKCSNVLSDKQVSSVFQVIVVLVILLNVYNLFQLMG